MKNNVVQFPKTTTKKGIFAPRNLVKNGKIIGIEITKNAFGFVAGDTLVCRTDFEQNELQADSLVIADKSGFRELTVYSSAKQENVVGIVDTLIRKIA